MEERTDREKTLIKSQADSSSLHTSIYGSLIPEIRRLEFCTLQRIVVGFEVEISALGDSCFVGGEEGIPLLGGRCWIGTHLVVSPLGLSYSINKLFEFLLHALYQ